MIYMLTFLYLCTFIAARLQLDNDPNNYVNYESAVNPEYYDQHYKNRKLTNPNYPNVHIKQGLSKPAEKMAYQILENNAINSFFSHLILEVCDSASSCSRNSAFMGTLEQIKDESLDIKEKFYESLRKKYIGGEINKIIDIYDRFYDVGYCENDLLRGITDDLNKVKLMADKSDVREVGKVVDLIKRVKNDYEDYKKKCNE